MKQLRHLDKDLQMSFSGLFLNIKGLFLNILRTEILEPLQIGPSRPIKVTRIIEVE
jgi:hypothetical protein